MIGAGRFAKVPLLGALIFATPRLMLSPTSICQR